MQTELRESLVQQADKAFLNLTDQIYILLDAAKVWATLHPPKTWIDNVKKNELMQAVAHLGSIPRLLVDEIRRWHRDEPRVLGRLGVETNLLNELYANMEAMLWFYMRENIEVPGFSLDLVKAAHSELLRCNRLL